MPALAFKPGWCGLISRALHGSGRNTGADERIFAVLCWAAREWVCSDRLMAWVH